MKLSRCFNIVAGEIGLLVIGATVTFAQNPLEKVGEGVLRSAQIGGEATLKAVQSMQRNVGPVTSALTEGSSVVDPGIVLPDATAALPASYRVDLQRSLILADREARLNAGEIFRGRKGVILHSTFLALSDDLFGYSGTVFKTTYQGKEEVYGVIAAHVINRNKLEIRFVHKTFNARVYAEGKMITIPAEIVQVGAPGMLDVALVKFRAEDEDLFKPLPLSMQEVSDGDKVRRQGFVRGKVVYMPGRPLCENSEMMFASKVTGSQHGRPGFCGGAVINEQNELVGIHVGSQASFVTNDIGLAVHAKFLQVLVEAYHNGGEAFYPFKLGGQTILSMRPDEYISDVVLRDAEKKRITTYRSVDKTTYQDIEKELTTSSVRYIEFTVRRVNWKAVHHEEILEDHKHTLIHKNLVTYVYDLQEQKIISQSKYTKVKEGLLNWLPSAR